MLRPSGPVAFFVMPGYEPHAGSPEVERDARGDHDLLFGADEEGELLRTLAPEIFSAGGDAGPITTTYGQFVSIMYEAMIIVPRNNGPTADKKFGSHRVESCPAQVVGQHAGNHESTWCCLHRQNQRFKTKG